MLLLRPPDHSPLQANGMPRIAFTLILLAGSMLFGQEQRAKIKSNGSEETSSAVLNNVIITAFESTHDGWSSDEVILNDSLNQAFIAACNQKLPGVDAAVFNWRLMNLRKAGKLQVKSTKSNRTSVSEVAHIAEIAARSMHDRHSISSDQVMADPVRRREFDEIAKSFDPEIDLYLVRKAAFQLRKTRKLKPELITRIADWSREIKTFGVEQIAANPELVQPHPGVYIFRDKTGYLYIGQSDDLQSRLKSHLDQSHNRSLASYLGDRKLEGITIEVHSFAPDSRATETMVRRAYESELIQSRKPRFNIQP